MTQFYNWDTSTHIPVSVPAIDIKALSDAIRVSKNILKELGVSDVYQQFQLANVKCQTGISFHADDNMISVYNIGAVEDMCGVIVLNKFPGVNKYELSKLLSADRYINDSFCINCISATETSCYIATIVLFPDKFDRDVLVDWFKTCTWKRLEDPIGIVRQRAMQIMEAKYHMETAEDFGFEERD